MPTYSSEDRRPIGSRNTRWAIAVTNWLVRRQASPNGISVFGMVAAIGAGGMFWLTAHVDTPIDRGCWIAGGLLCQVRLLCNLFDGMVAIERGIASAVGELFNEVPDRVSDAAVMIGLGYAMTGNTTAGLLAALACVFVAYIRAIGKAAGVGNEFCGPMAKPQRMALATGLAMFMGLAPDSWRSNAQSPSESFGWAAIVLVVVIVGCGLTAIRRLRRIVAELQGASSDNH